MSWRTVAVCGSGLLALGLWAALVVGPVRAQAPSIEAFNELITLKPNGDAAILEVWKVLLAPGVLITLTRPLPLTDTAAVTDFSVTNVNPVESKVTLQQGHVVLQWQARPDPQKPDMLFLVSYTIHGVVQSAGKDYLFTWVAIPADFPYVITSTVVDVSPPYPFPDSALQYHLSVGGAVVDNTCYSLSGTNTINGTGACYVNDQSIAYTAVAFTGQPWQVSLRYPQGVPPPTPTLFVPTPTPRLQVTSAETPAPFVNSLLALAVSVVVVSLLWAWARPAPSLPLHEVIVVGIVATGATLAAGLLGLVWLRPGSFYWILVLVFGAALLITALIVLPWAVFEGRAYDRDRRQMLAGQNLAHWNVTAEEHRQFILSEVDRLRHSAWLFLIGTGVVTLIGLVFGGLAGLGLLLGGILLAAGLLATASYAVPYVRLQASLASGQAPGPGELYVSGKGALLFGRYVPLQGFNLWVESVSLTEEEPLRLKFRTVSRGNRGSRIINEIYVPVPPEQRVEAEALAASYPVTNM